MYGYVNKLNYDKNKYYMSAQLYLDNKDKWEYIENEIIKGLKNYPNFDYIDFCNVGADGVQIRCFHKEIKGYSYGPQITVKYDMSNYLECIQEVIEMWKEFDTPEKVESYKKFIADCEKYGWD